MKREVKDCYCGNKYYHTSKCRRLKRLDNLNALRKKLRKEHRCICCKKKVEPIFPQFCKEHRKR